VKITAVNYEQMRQWYAMVFEVDWDGRPLDPEHHPIKVLDEMAKRTPARARAGLAMAIGDIMEGNLPWRPERVAALDSELQDQGLPTFSAIQREFGKGIEAIMKRGRIRSEPEYHLVRNAAEVPGMPEEDLWKLLEDYEARATR
jgi:hypothetical protein